MKALKHDHQAKLLQAISRIAAGRTDGRPMAPEAAMALARSTLVSIGERVPAIHIPKRAVYFKVETVDGQAVLREMDDTRAA